MVDVDNEQSAIELRDFYSHSIDLIQYFLLSNAFLSETRSDHLQSIFSEMNFVSVECIRLSYRFRENIVRKAPSSTNLDSYIDESTRKFYILQKYEKSEIRHIDTMVNYLTTDESARLKLSQYIRYLFKIYQDEGLQGLTKQHDGLSGQKVSKWVIPQIIKKEPTPPSSSDEEEEEDVVNNEPIDIPREMLEELINEPGWQMPKPNPNFITDPNQPDILKCYPPNAGAAGFLECSDIKHPAKSELQSTEIKPSITTEQNILPSASNTNNGSEQIDDKKNAGQTVPRESNIHSDSES